jgi:hypothetical protein
MAAASTDCFELAITLEVLLHSNLSLKANRQALQPSLLAGKSMATIVKPDVD